MSPAPATREEAIALIRGTTLRPRVDELVRALRPSIRLVLDREGGSRGPLGASRFGGDPDLPAGVAWPTWPATELQMGGRRTQPVETALTFIAQLRLSDLAHLDPDGPLPHEGLLYFFYDVETQPWCLDESEIDGARVLFEPDETRSLTRTPRPATSEGNPIVPRAVHPRLEFSLPTYAPFETNTAEDDEYDRLRTALAGETGVDWPTVHRVLGYADGVQDPPEDCGPDAYRGPAERADAPASEWLLLLQVDSEDESGGWCFGDLGCVFFMIHRDDLRERQFDRAWYTLQCT